jgi:hypothetical protein
MIRTLSASGTFVHKYVFLALWLCISGGLNILMWSGRLFELRVVPPSLGIKIIYLAFLLVPPPLILWMTRLHKRVRMSDDGLLIRDSSQEVFVPFSAIESVSRPKTEPNAYVEVRFRAPTVFGNRIRFVPRPRHGFLPWLDPAVREFLERVTVRSWAS